MTPLYQSDAELARSLVWEIDDDEAEATLRDARDRGSPARFSSWSANEEFADLLVRLDDRACRRRSRADSGRSTQRTCSKRSIRTTPPTSSASSIATHSDDILVAMEPEEAEEIRELLAYPPIPPADIMTPAFVSIAPTLRADQAIAALRKVAEEAETDQLRLCHRSGRSPPRRAVTAQAGADPSAIHRCGDLMYHPTDHRSCRLPTRKKPPRSLIDNDLLAIPVIDDEHHILGIITVDDITEVLEREVTEDIERLAVRRP